MRQEYFEVNNERFTQLLLTTMFRIEPKKLNIKGLFLHDDLRLDTESAYYHKL